MPHVLAGADFSNPLFWAILVAWIMTVVLHEFAHGLVAHWGGDYTIGERGGLTLNPLQYIDPVFSILLPAIFLAMGGVPLPGGVTYIRMDLIRSRAWQSAVSLAGPAMNLLIFLVGALALHPAVGWVPRDAPLEEWSGAQRVLATLTTLQLFAVMLNLIPVPPLDGFGAISPYLRPTTRDKLSTPPTSIVLMLIVFMLVMNERVQLKFYRVIFDVYEMLGYSDIHLDNVRRAFNQTLHG